MGLSAVVYKRRDAIDPTIDRSWLRFEEDTGQTYLADDAPGPRLPNEVFNAHYERFGNVAWIMAIRAALEEKPAKTRFLLERVVYNATHGGDQIALGEIPAMLKELDYVERHLIRDDTREFLEHFVNALRDLARAAEEQQHPIVFL